MSDDFFFFFKQKTAYEMRISDWSSDVCSSDLGGPCILSTGLKRPSAGGLSVLELVKAGGWPMIPLLLLSAVALAIIVERFWALRRKAVLPPGLGGEVRAWASRGNLDPAHIDSLRGNSPLGALLAAAMAVRNRERQGVWTGKSGSG